MSTRSGHKVALAGGSSGADHVLSRNNNNNPLNHNIDEDIEFTTTSSAKSHTGYNDKSRRQRLIRWILSTVPSSSLIQRVFVLRKYYVVFLALAGVLSIYALQKQVQKTTHRNRPLPPWPLPSVALKRMLSTSSTLDRPKSNFDSSSGWPRVSYFSELPSVDDPLWPPLPDDHQATSTPTSIATCVPGLAKDIYDESRIVKFLISNQRQHVKAKELVFLLSDVDAVLAETTGNGSGHALSGEQWCQDAYKFLQDFHSNLVMVCVGERITAGRARNVLARVATADVLAFIDTDDEEEPGRNQVIQQIFDCHPALKLLIHSNYGTGHGFYGKVRYHPYESAVAAAASTATLAGEAATTRTSNYGTSSTASTAICPDEDPNVEVIRGLALREMLDQTQDVLKFGIRTVGGMRPGHLVVKRDVTRYVRSSSIYKGQDTLWARDIIYMYGRSDEAAMFLNRPLTTYYQSSHSFNVNVRSKK